MKIEEVIQLLKHYEEEVENAKQITFQRTENGLTITFKNN